MSGKASQNMAGRSQMQVPLEAVGASDTRAAEGTHCHCLQDHGAPVVVFAAPNSDAPPGIVVGGCLDIN